MEIDGREWLLENVLEILDITIKSDKNDSGSQGLPRNAGCMMVIYNGIKHGKNICSGARYRVILKKEVNLCYHTLESGQ